MIVTARTAAAALSSLRLAMEHCEQAAASATGPEAAHIEATAANLAASIRTMTSIRDALLVAGPIGTVEQTTVVPLRTDIAIPTAIALPLPGARRLAAG